MSRLGLFAVVCTGAFALVLAVAQDRDAQDRGDREPAAPAASVLVDDKAKLFKSDIVSQARSKILHIKDLYAFSIFVETLAELPEKDLKKISTAPNAGRAFQEWAEGRARQAMVDGLYIVLSKDPKHPNSAVVVSPESQKEFFTPRDADNLRKQFASAHFTQQPNQVLLEALDSVNNTLHDNRESPKSVSWSLIVTILLVCIGVWVGLGALRGLRNQSRDGQPARATGEPHTNNKMMPALLGGMFGNIAGHWLYDTIFRAGSDKQGSPADPLADRIEIKDDRRG
jgi:hypothetical protein